MKDGIYLEVFAVYKGNRVNFKIISLEYLTKALTNGMLDAIQDIVELRDDSCRKEGVQDG